MKKIIFALLLITNTTITFAQDDEEGEKTKFFKKENLFTGGSITASFFSGGTVLGLSPYFGYSLNKYIDVAVSANVNYTSIRDAYYAGDKSRQTVIGPGAFVRLYPVKFIFAQVQFEQNFIKEKYIYPSNLSFPTETTSYNVSSFLVGGGYCSGRQGTGDIFYYFSVMWDLKKDINSPYVDGLGRTVPIIRAGLNIPLFQGDRRRR
jgi:hypothetical protein